MNDIEQAIEWLKENLPSLEDYGEMVGAPTQYCGVKYVYNDPCGYVFETAIEALQEKLEREKNPPLTLEELGVMAGEPVWIKTIDSFWDGWGIVTGGCDLVYDGDGDEWYTEEYGSKWLAYRHKPGHFRDLTNKIDISKSGEDNG